MATPDTRRQWRHCLLTNNIFQLRIHNSQIVKKEDSYQTFNVSKNCFFHAPIHRGYPTGGCAPPRQGDKAGKKKWDAGNGTQTKRGLADGKGRPPDTSCVAAQTRAGHKALGVISARHWNWENTPSVWTSSEETYAAGSEFGIELVTTMSKTSKPSNNAVISSKENGNTVLGRKKKSQWAAWRSCEELLCSRSDANSKTFSIQS